MMRPLAVLVTVLLTVSVPLLAQGGPGRPPGPPGQPEMVLGDADPIGTLLERRDSLRLADSVVTQLVQLNLRFFRRKRSLQMRLDSLLPDGPQGGFERPEMVTPPGRDSVMDARVRPIFDQLREAIRAARDSAYAMLTPAQREHADSLAHRALTGRRGGRGRDRPR